MRAVAILALALCLTSAFGFSNPHWEHLEGHEIKDSHAFSFRIGLNARNLDTMDKLFWQIADPKSPLFGKFLTNEQIADLISPPEEEIAAVEKYFSDLSTKGSCKILTSRSLHGEYLHVNTCVDQATKIFPLLQLGVYKHDRTEKKILRSQYLMDLTQNSHFLGVPAELHQFIDGIHDVSDLPMHLSHVESNYNPAEPWMNNVLQLTIQDMIDNFGVSYSGINSSTLNLDEAQVRQAVMEFDGAAFSPTELQDFQEKYGIAENPIRKTFGTEVTTSGLSIEASLDVQTITGIAQNVQTWDFVFDADATFSQVVDTIMGTPGAPHVISCSWGGPEVSGDKTASLKASTAFMKMGLAGFTFMAAAGDTGPSLNPEDCSHYIAQFPSTSPYVFSVGGTKVNKYTMIEGAWTHSSGGFSAWFDRPSHQDDAVNYYIKNGPLPPNPDGRYTTTGRAFPDVSAYGAFEPVLANGAYVPVGGTSGACPQFAAMITMINIHRYQNGLGPIGSMNAIVYKLQNGVGFDVTEGMSYASSRYGCDGKFLGGYRAFQGWDPVTGVGSPRFPTLLDQLANLDYSSTDSESQE